MDKDKNTLNLWNQWAERYQDKFMEMKWYRSSFDDFCCRIQNGDSILEIGCGPGNVSHYLLAKLPELKIFGIDLSPRMIELAKANNPTANYEVMDCRDIGALDKIYDHIICAFCTPYISTVETVQLIQEAGDLIRKGGILYLSTTEDDPQLSGFKGPSDGGEDSLYIQYYEESFLTDHLKRNDFAILDVYRKKYPEQKGTTEIDLFIFAQKI